MIDILTKPHIAFSLVFLACVSALMAAYTFQYAGGLDPCILCLYQRIPFYIAGVFAFLGIFSDHRKTQIFFLTLCGLVLLGNAALAFFHVGVEQKWWEGIAECRGATIKATTIEDLKTQIMEARLPRCDEIAWSLWGISMAGWNILLCLALAGYSLMIAQKWK